MYVVGFMILKLVILIAVSHREHPLKTFLTIGAVQNVVYRNLIFLFTKKVRENSVMKLGKFEIQTVSGGKYKLDGGAVFRVIPKPLWEKTNPLVCYLMKIIR